MDDDTKTLIHLVAVTLQKHADNQELIIHNQTAILGLLQGQQADNVKTGNALATLVEDLRKSRTKVEEHRAMAKARMEQARKDLARQ